MVAGGDAADVVAAAGLVLVPGQRRARTALVQVRAVDLDAPHAGPGFSACI